MTVEVTSMGIQAGAGGGVSADTEYSTNFVGLPSNGAPEWTAGYANNASSPIFAFNNSFQVQGGGVGGNPSMAQPTFNAVLKRVQTHQYVQAKYLRTTAGTFRGGLALAMSGSCLAGAFNIRNYYLQMVVDGNTANFQNQNDAGIGLVNGVLVPADNDTYEIQVDYETPVGSNTVRLWQTPQAGVATLRMTLVDNHGNRPRGGAPGFYYDNAGGGLQEWITFITRAQR